MQAVSIPAGTGCARAPSAVGKPRGRVFAWGLFVIPRSGFKNNWLRASAEPETRGAVVKNIDPRCEQPPPASPLLEGESAH